MPAWPRGSGAEGTLGTGRPKTLIMDVCGAYMRPAGGWFSVSGLVSLLCDLGVDEQATRSAISRMRRRGLLDPETRSGTRGYRLTEMAESALPGTTSRIFASVEPADLAEGWVFVAFSIPESARDLRHQLRSRLSWLNFGMVTNGLWMAPARRQKEIEDSVLDLGLQAHVTIVLGEHAGFESLPELVARCWDIEGLRALYRDYLDETQPLIAGWRGGGGTGQRSAAFVDYTVALHKWRKFPYLDPGLPEELLPDGFEGPRAAEVFFELRDLLEASALRYACEVGLGT